MTPIIKAYWKELKRTALYYQKKNKNICFNEDKYNEFHDVFEATYRAIRAEYMKENVTALDRHKVAAVMIVTTIETQVISYSEPIPEGQHFLGSEMLSTEVALSWMLDTLNKKLVEVGKVPIEAYFMPQAFSCDTPYFEIFTRNLFFTHKDYRLSPLDISEKLFLMEYITLLKNDIAPEILCN